MVAARAWPYAVTRGAAAGYQAIVGPGFLADAGQAYVLEYASREEMSGADAITVREVLGVTREPLSLAYRVLEARAHRYGLGGDGVLEDRAGRAIRVFEGLVLQLPAERVPSLGLTTADFDAVTAVTAPAFRKLCGWRNRTWCRAAPLNMPASAASRRTAARRRPVNRVPGAPA